MRGDGAERHQQLVIYGLGIVEEGANNTLNALDARSIQGWVGVLIWEELFLHAINDFTMFMWCMLWLAWMGMVVFEQQGVDVCVHEKAACLLGVVPLDVKACNFDASPVGGDCEVLLEGM